MLSGFSSCTNLLKKPPPLGVASVKFAKTLDAVLEGDIYGWDNFLSWKEYEEAELIDRKYI